MPIIPGPPLSTPYDEIETILYFARVIANDAGISIAGNLLADSQPYVLPMLNLAWRKLQDKLLNNNIEALPQEEILTNIPAQAASAFADPAILAYINYTMYFDGVSGNPNFNLPSNCVQPVRLWERVTGQNAQFIPMHQAKDGIPSRTKTSYWRTWEWRDEAIYIPGANQNLDLRIRYKTFLQDVVLPNTNVIPLLRCAVALAYLFVEIFAGSRGSVVLPVFNTEREEAIKQLINLTTRKFQRINYRRIPYSRRSRY